MEVIARRGDREERVRILPIDKSVFEVTVGERTYRVEAIPAGQGYSLCIGGEQHEVAVLPRGPSAYWVGAGQSSGLVEIEDLLTHLARAGQGGAGARRHKRITAYMPGRVVAVLAAEGDEVTAGQGIVVLEAMKMQNEIQAEHPGTLHRIFVQPGQAVEGGDPLFEME